MNIFIFLHNSGFKIANILKDKDYALLQRDLEAYFPRVIYSHSRVEPFPSTP